MVELTPEEARSLEQHLEWYIIQEIKDSPDDYDSIGYLTNLVHVYEKCQAAEGTPADNVRPVVLCKDCRHRDPEDHKCDCGQLERAGCVFIVDDDYFCAYGERREKI